MFSKYGPTPWQDVVADNSAARYIYDIEGTQKSLTTEGFFKTGDVAEKVGDIHFLKGRKSVDSKDLNSRGCE
jgi:hypothetical protein